VTAHPPEHPGDLTPLQRQFLRNLRESCATPPTLGRLYAWAWRPTLFLLLVGSVFVWLLLEVERPAAAALLGGMTAGALLRDFGYLRRSVLLWPVIAAVTDRRRLNEFLGEPEPPADRP
jgi:hypothetical protein